MVFYLQIKLETNAKQTKKISAFPLFIDILYIFNTCSRYSLWNLFYPTPLLYTGDKKLFYIL